MIADASPLARAIALVLQKHDFRVLLADSSWDNIRAAMMDNLPTFYGNVVSEHADRRLDLVGIGRLLALSGVREENALAAMRYRAEFGAANVFTLQVAADKEGDTKTDRPPEGHMAFAEDVSFTQYRRCWTKARRFEAQA